MRTFLSFVLLTAFLSVGSSLFAQGKGGGAPTGHAQSGSADRGDKNPKSDAKTTTATASGTNPMSSKLSEHPELASKVQSMLPKGTSLDTAASGFKKLGQFVAAVHVSNNLNIPFDQLKGKMVNDAEFSLGHSPFSNDLQCGVSQLSGHNDANHHCRGGL